MDDTPEQTPATTTGSVISALPRSLLPVAILAGVLAGLLAFLAGEAILRAYQSNSSATLKARPTPEDIKQQILTTFGCASVTFAALGGLLGITLGLTGALIGRSSRRALLGAMVGLALGGGMGGVMSRVLVPISYQQQNTEANDLLLPLLILGAIWSTLGITAGIAFGFGLGPNHWKSAAVGGLAGAVLATIVYEVAGAIAFPTARTDLPLSLTMTTRGMAHLLVTSFVAAGAALTVGRTQTAPDRSS